MPSCMRRAYTLGSVTKVVPRSSMHAGRPAPIIPGAGESA